MGAPSPPDRGIARSTTGMKSSVFLLAFYRPVLERQRVWKSPIPRLYLKGVSEGDFNEALAVIVGKDTKGFSRPVVGKSKAKWKDEFEAWRMGYLSSSGCLSTRTALNMAFKLCQSTERKWRKLRGCRRLAEAIEEVSSIDGISERDIVA